MEISTDYISEAQYQFLPFSDTLQEQLEKSPKDKNLQGNIDKIVLQILQKNPTIQEQYKFIVFRSDSTQILHTRWGKIFIPDTLIQLTKNDAELTFILAHEIWHWENKDIKSDAVKKYISPGEVYESECLADWYAWKVTKILWYDRVYIDSFLTRLEDSKLRQKNICEE